MALGLGAEVPWVMCQQKDAPSTIVKLLPYLLNFQFLFHILVKKVEVSLYFMKFFV